MKRKLKGRRWMARLMSMTMMITLMPTTLFAAAEDNLTATDAGSAYVLMNIPYADFYKDDANTREQMAAILRRIGIKIHPPKSENMANRT